MDWNHLYSFLSLIDWNYLYSFLSFLIGVLAGFQGIYERYKGDSLTASCTPLGISYLISRGVVSALIFVYLYYYQIIKSSLLLYALACGTVTEYFLRSKVYLKQVQKGKEGGESIEELFRGPLDLLRWYQGLFLEGISERLARSRKKFVTENLPPSVNFLDLCNRVLNNIDAYPNPQLKPDVEGDIKRLQDEFKKEQQSTEPQEVEQKYRLKLGYQILTRFGRHGFTTLLAS